MNQNLLKSSGTPAPGNSFELIINDPLDAGKQYFILASFGNYPAIILPDGRVIYLTNDGLFSYIIQSANTGFFQNTYGTLDQLGRAIATISIPNIPGLSGLDLYFAFVTLDPNAPSSISRISHTIKVTIT